MIQYHKINESYLIFRISNTNLLSWTRLYLRLETRNYTQLKICLFCSMLPSSTVHYYICWSPSLEGKLVYRSCGTSLYRERLQQQNGDMRKRDKVEATCTWLHLVQGHICSPSPLLALPLPLSHPPPINVIRGASLRPFPPPPPPPTYSPLLDFGHFWRPRLKSRTASV